MLENKGETRHFRLVATTSCRWYNHWVIEKIQNKTVQVNLYNYNTFNFHSPLEKQLIKVCNIVVPIKPIHDLKQKGFAVYCRARCGPCYTSDRRVSFHLYCIDLWQKESKKGKKQVRLRLAWSRKHRKTTDFFLGRDGDNLPTIFECDWCIFLKLTDRYPIIGLYRTSCC